MLREGEGVLSGALFAGTDPEQDPNPQLPPGGDTALSRALAARERRRQRVGGTPPLILQHVGSSGSPTDPAAITHHPGSAVPAQATGEDAARVPRVPGWQVNRSKRSHPRRDPPWPRAGPPSEPCEGLSPLRGWRVSSGRREPVLLPLPEPEQGCLPEEGPG